MKAFLCALAMVGVCLTNVAWANLSFTTFPNSTGLTLVTNAAVTSNVLRITPSTTNKVGAAWANTQQQVGAGFTTTFTFKITNQVSGGADGFAFVIQNSAPNAIGGGGCQIGYDPIPNSLAVEIDTYQSGACSAGDVNDINDNHISIHTQGTLANSAQESASIGAATVLPDMSDGAVHTIKIDYFPGEMDVYLDDMTTPRIAVPLALDTTLSLAAGKAWVGFTGATGGAAERHDITSWTFTEGAPPGSGRPRTPLITQPASEGVVVNPQDVHMETGPFFSSTGFNHLCTDWQLWTTGSSAEMIWHADCITGVERVHIHLADGTFAGSFTGRRDLVADTDYQLMARHRDDSGIAATEWSLWGQRAFHAGGLGTNLPLLVEDVVSGVQWQQSDGSPVVLPAATGGSPSAVVLEGGTGGTLLTFGGFDGVTNTVVNPASVGSHVQVRVRVDAGDAPLTLAPSTIRFVDEDCASHVIYMPAISLDTSGEALFWASGSGSTYVALATQDHADLTNLARGSDTPFVVTQPGYVLEKFASGLQLPVNIAFVPNPGPNPGDLFCYVNELYGTILAVTRDGHQSVYKDGMLNYVPSGAFPGSGEQGMAGIAIDPTNGDLFIGALIDDGTNTENRYGRVMRLQSTDGGWTASSVTVLLAMPGEIQGQSHMISNFSFGPDGYLYVHNGDGFDASKGQDLTSFRGKILRLKKDGLPVPSNPFYNAADGITSRDYVYAYGLRNPFGGAWRQSDGHHFTVENGPAVDRVTMLVAGQNYLYDGSDNSMYNFALFNWVPAHGPVNITFVESAVFGGSGFPPDKFGHAFVSESGPTWADGPQELGKRVVEFAIDSSGTLVSGPTSLVEYAGSGRGSVVAIAAGPDGLYFSDMYKDLNYDGPTDFGANIWRLRYVGGNGNACCSADFNGDGDLGTDSDIAAFFACLAGDCCPTCQSADFNHDGDIGTDSDIEAFFRVLGGGSC